MIDPIRPKLGMINELRISSKSSPYPVSSGLDGGTARSRGHSATDMIAGLRLGERPRRFSDTQGGSGIGWLSHSLGVQRWSAPFRRPSPVSVLSLLAALACRRRTRRR
jgi:hypothetical protein